MRNNYLHVIYLISTFIIYLNFNLYAESDSQLNEQYLENIIQKANPKLYTLLRENSGIKNFSEELMRFMEENKIPVPTLRFVLKVMPEPQIESKTDIEKLRQVISQTIKDVDISLRRGNFYNSLRFQVIKRLKSYNRGSYNTKRKKQGLEDTMGSNQAIKKMEQLNRANIKDQIKTRIKETHREHTENEHAFQEEPIHHPN